MLTKQLCFTRTECHLFIITYMVANFGAATVTLCSEER